MPKQATERVSSCNCSVNWKYKCKSEQHAEREGSYYYVVYQIYQCKSGKQEGCDERLENNENRLVNLCDGARLIVCETLFPHQNIFEGSRKSPKQIVHAIITRGNGTFLQDVIVF